LSLSFLRLLPNALLLLQSKLSLAYPGAGELKDRHRLAARHDLRSLGAVRSRLSLRQGQLGAFLGDCGVAAAALEERLASLAQELGGVRRAEAAAASLHAAVVREARALRLSAVVVVLNLVLRDGWLDAPDSADPAAVGADAGVPVKTNQTEKPQLTSTPAPALKPPRKV
jgi:hypothetical protein